MALLGRARRMAAVCLAAASLAATASAARAADPYEINAILDLTGYASFVGTTQLQALRALETYVNKNGGIGGRPVSFVVADDQSNPQVTVQLVQGLIAKHVPVILGPSGPDKCAAAMPLVMQAGPVLYCTTPNAAAPPGSYVFLSLFSAESNMAVTIRYLRERGLHKLAYLGSNDATGQDAERWLNEALAKPENASVQLVSRQHFAPSDLSVAAQLAAIKAANPDALIAWSAGTPAGTIFHGTHDAGLDLPTVTSAANLNLAFFKQYGALTPKNLYFAGAPYYGADAVTNPATKAALATLTTALAAAGAKPDLIEISAWDPGLLLVDALRKLGTDTTAAKLRAYLVNLKGWVGANGPYDFSADPQHGLGENTVVIVKWDPDRNAATAVSKFGGAPLPGK
jgi:branched-chain amino acid transport system substrate-binding protein